MQEQIPAVIVKQWMRIHHIECDFIDRILKTILIYFDQREQNEEEISNELFVNVLVVGGGDKIGLIYNYVYDYNCDQLLEHNNKLKLCKHNEKKVIELNKIVKLSSRNSVNISIACLSELQTHLLSEICTSATKSIIFTYNLCDQSSLQSIRKLYKDCCKINNSFISILVGTNYENFKDKAANYRISLIELSRKYANKMRGILVFISTVNKQQINIKEIFLIILSKIYHFDSHIIPISNSKLPIIEFYDHKQRKSKTKTKTKSKEKSNTYSNKNKKQYYYYGNNTRNNNTANNHMMHTYNTSTYNASIYHHNNDHDRHNRTRTSISHIQNRLSIIRSNLSKKNNQKNKVEQLYNKFEKNHETFMKNVETSANNGSDNSDNDNDNDNDNNSENNNDIYPSFLHNNNNNNDNDQKEQQQEEKEDDEHVDLSDLLKNDALGLHSLDNEPAAPDIETNEQQNRKKKHERAMSMMPSLLHKAKTYDTTNSISYYQQRGKHNRAMPSMPNFLSKLQHDNQLKNIISNVFINNKAPGPGPVIGVNGGRARSRTHTHTHTATAAAVTVAAKHKHKHKHNKNKTIHKLQNKIQNLESSLNKYKHVMIENSKTVSVLKETICKIETQRDEATKKINSLENNKQNDKQIEKLKNKNVELSSLADALAINLTRKQQSLEEALTAIHTLNAVKDEMTNEYNNNTEKEIEKSKSKSLTESDILLLSHNVHNDYDDEQIDQQTNNSKNARAITRRLRNSLTKLTNLDTKLSK